jgi:hypothetical protein
VVGFVGAAVDDGLSADAVADDVGLEEVIGPGKHAGGGGVGDVFLEAVVVVAMAERAGVGPLVERAGGAAAGGANEGKILAPAALGDGLVDQRPVDRLERVAVEVLLLPVADVHAQHPRGGR